MQDRNPAFGPEDTGAHRRDPANNRVTPAWGQDRQHPLTGWKRRVGTVVSPNALAKHHPEDREQADGGGYGGD